MAGDDSGRRSGEPRFRAKPTYAERRAERAELDDPAIVLAAAARILESRARSVQEVRVRLVQAGYRAGLVDGAIMRLTELGMLDDEAFARAWVQSRDRARPRGTRALRDELRRKGVDQPTVDAILAERDGAGDGPAGDGPNGDGPNGDGTAATEPPAFGQLRAKAGGDLESGERADAVAARRLLDRHAAALARVPDRRTRRQRAYGLLARNGFPPDLITDLVRELDGMATAEDAGTEPDDEPDKGGSRAV